MRPLRKPTLFLWQRLPHPPSVPGPVHLSSLPSAQVASRYKLTCGSLPLKLHCCFLSASALHSSCRKKEGECGRGSGGCTCPAPPPPPPAVCIVFTPTGSVFLFSPLPSCAQPGQPPASSHLLVLPAWQEAGTTVESKESLSGTHVQSPAIPAQQKGRVVGNVFSFKSEEWPLFRAWERKTDINLGATPPTRNLFCQPRGRADLKVSEQGRARQGAGDGGSGLRGNAIPGLSNIV